MEKEYTFKVITTLGMFRAGCLIRVRAKTTAMAFTKCREILDDKEILAPIMEVHEVQYA